MASRGTSRSAHRVGWGLPRAFVGHYSASMKRLAVMCWFLLLLLLACSPAAEGPHFDGAASFDAATLNTCEGAFRRWVDESVSLNDPDVDLTETLSLLEAIQRRVFELCSLAEAERYNLEVLWKPSPGISQPLIEVGFRTFAEIECVDEAPLLDGTPSAPRWATRRPCGRSAS